MLEDPPVLKLRRHFPRPDAAVVKALTGVPTGHVVDCMDGQGALDYRVKPLEPGNSSFTGVAVTCDCGPADNLGVLGALAIARPGDVIVAAAAGHLGTAVIGDLVLGMLRNAGVVGFATDGLVRDIEGLIEVGVPVFAKGVTPNSPARNGPATAGLPVNLDSVHVASGDLIVADRDGVVVVPRERAPRVAEQAQGVRQAEAALLEKIRGGMRIPPFYETLVEAGKVEEWDA